jgi:hypothetical protein
LSWDFSWERREKNTQSLFPISASFFSYDHPLCFFLEKIDVMPIDPHAMFLGIHGGKLCLSCVKSANDIRLQLEVRILFG